MGCAVETATNGLLAIECYSSGQFDLIFMDCQMPEIDGYEATVEIRRLEASSHRRTPIIALTGNVIEGARQRCLAAGMDDYLAKPFTLDQMKAILTQWLKSSSSARARGLALIPASPQPAELVDFEVLDSLRHLQRDGRADVAQQVIRLFFKAAADLLMDLQEGVASNDAARLHNASHALKSVSANVGAVALSSHCSDLEAMTQCGAVTEAAAIVREIIEDYRAAEILLSSRLPKVA
jgi:CheY-like chemotaxis protein/HPt (histidine-containing phosphotransfer) domain-containing protein